MGDTCYFFSRVDGQGKPLRAQRSMYATTSMLAALLNGHRGDALCSITEDRQISVLPYAETEELLHSFARWCVLSVANLWNMPGDMLAYLASGDEALRDDAYYSLSAAIHASQYVFEAARIIGNRTHAAHYAASRAAAWAAAAGRAESDDPRAAQERQLRDMFNAAVEELAR